MSVEESSVGKGGLAVGGFAWGTESSTNSPTASDERRLGPVSQCPRAVVNSAGAATGRAINPLETPGSALMHRNVECELGMAKFDPNTPHRLLRFINSPVSECFGVSHIAPRNFECFFFPGFTYLANDSLTVCMLMMPGLLLTRWTLAQPHRPVGA